MGVVCERVGACVCVCVCKNIYTCTCVCACLSMFKELLSGVALNKARQCYCDVQTIHQFVGCQYTRMPLEYL